MNIFYRGKTWYNKSSERRFSCSSSRVLSSTNTSKCVACCSSRLSKSSTRLTVPAPLSNKSNMTNMSGCAGNSLGLFCIE